MRHCLRVADVDCFSFPSLSFYTTRQPTPSRSICIVSAVTVVQQESGHAHRRPRRCRRRRHESATFHVNGREIALYNLSVGERGTG